MISAKTSRKASPTIFQMYIENNCRFGFYVHRDSWSNNKYAMVVSIEGVTDGEMIDGKPSYYKRFYPAGHPKEGEDWPRAIVLQAQWLDGGEVRNTSGGVSGWSRINPGV